MTERQAQFHRGWAPRIPWASHAQTAGASGARAAPPAPWEAPRDGAPSKAPPRPPAWRQTLGPAGNLHSDLAGCGKLGSEPRGQVGRGQAHQGGGVWRQGARRERARGTKGRGCAGGKGQGGTEAAELRKLRIVTVRFEGL